MTHVGMSLLRCVALAAMMGCAARAGGGVFIPPDDEDAGSTTGPDVVNPATDTGGATACTPPEFNCNGRCANLLTDSANCGMCGRACPGGSACSAGTCVTSPACQAPRMTCGGACVDVTTSTAHCGACGNACASGQSCVGGACMGGGGCPGGQTSCGGTCVDTRTNAQNCGLCGIACAGGQTCANGACVGGQACIAPRMMCGADCVDVLSSPQHCGFCNRACAAGQTCNSGTCTGGGGGCTAPNISCGGACVNPLNNAQNCGSCLNACAAGQSCTNGLCSGGGGTGGVAGRSCTGVTDTSCGTALECANVGGQFTCTGGCLLNSSQTNERGQCGGGSSTCLTLDAMTGDGFCTASCVANGGTCRAGTACTTRSLQLTTPDTAGCFPFCRTNSHCAPGSVCNVRTGFCGPTAANLTRLPDGNPCNPTITETPPGETAPRNTQCRGVCFRTSATVMTQGICGSLINLTETTTCPDPGVGARGSMTDEIGICIYRDCTRNADCGTTLRCVYPERNNVPDRTLDPICNYTTTAQPTGIP